jgi:CheY-like chemotaxis protein
MCGGDARARLCRMSSLRVLVVDHDPRVLRALTGLLSATDGLSVSATATTAPDALAADAEHAPDVAVVDLMLPGLDDGLGLVRRLFRRGRVVLATSLSGAAREAGLAAGASGFVEKAGDPEAVVAAVTRAVGA